MGLFRKSILNIDIDLDSKVLAKPVFYLFKANLQWYLEWALCAHFLFVDQQVISLQMKTNLP